MTYQGNRHFFKCKQLETSHSATWINPGTILFSLEMKIPIKLWKKLHPPLEAGAHHFTFTRNFRLLFKEILKLGCEPMQNSAGCSEN